MDILPNSYYFYYGALEVRDLILGKFNLRVELKKRLKLLSL